MFGQPGAQSWETGNICLLGPEAWLGRQSCPRVGAKRVQRPLLKALGSRVPFAFLSVGLWWVGLAVRK